MSNFLIRSPGTVNVNDTSQMQQSSIKRSSNTWSANSNSFSTRFACNLCKERDDEAKLLPCFHAFCRQCGDNMTSTASTQSAIICATCREDPLMDDPSPIALNCLQFLLPNRDDDYENGAPTYCRTCNNGTRAVAWCRQCNDGLCQTCVIAHNRVRVTQDHCIDKISDSIVPFHSSWQPFAMSPSRDEIHCEDHANDEAVFYCELCRQAMCTICRFSTHTGHNISLLKEALATSRNQSSRILDNMKSDLKEVEDCVLTFDRMKDRVDMRCKAILNEIRNVSMKLRNVVENRERDLAMNLEKIRQLKVKFLQLQREDVKELHLSLTKKHEILKSSFESAKNLEVFNVRDQLIAFAQELNKSKNLPKSNEDDTIIFSPPNGIVVNTIQTIGNLSSSTFAPNSYAIGSGLKKALVNRIASFIVHAKDHLGEPKKTGGEMPIVIIQSATQGSIVQADVLDRNNGTYLVSYKPLIQGEHVISVTIRGIHLALSPFTVLVSVPRDLSSLRTPLWCFGSKGEADGQLRRPWGVCCDKEGHIIVADRSNNRIQFFSIQGIFLYKFGSPGILPGEFNLPAGVVVDNDGRIIVADKDNHRIQVFTNTGKFILTFGERGCEDGQFKYPWDVAVNSHRQILVCDSRNHRIQLFTPEGLFLHKYGFGGHLWKNFDSPRGVCFNQNDEILVTDFNNHRILVILPDFQNARSLGSEGTEHGQFRRPQGIAVDSEGHIIVADSRNNRIQIFKENGTFLHSIGVMGSAPGQLNCPSGICVSPDGLIVIVDFENTRIQVF